MNCISTASRLRSRNNNNIELGVRTTITLKPIIMENKSYLSPRLVSLSFTNEQGFCLSGGGIDVNNRTEIFFNDEEYKL